MVLGRDDRTDDSDEANAGVQRAQLDDLYECLPLRDYGDAVHWQHAVQFHRESGRLQIDRPVSTRGLHGDDFRAELHLGLCAHADTVSSTTPRRMASTCRTRASGVWPAATFTPSCLPRGHHSSRSTGSPRGSAGPTTRASSSSEDSSRAAKKRARHYAGADDHCISPVAGRVAGASYETRLPCHPFFSSPKQKRCRYVTYSVIGRCQDKFIEIDPIL